MRLFFLAALLSVVSTFCANATVIYTDVNPDLSITPDDPNHFINFNIFSQEYGLDDFSFSATHTLYYNFNNPGDPILIAGGGQTVDAPNSGSLLKLAESAVIDSSLTYYEFAGNLSQYWSGGGTGVVGFTYLNYYAWVRLDVEPVEGVGLSATLIDFAFEDQPDIPISGPVAVPEPATATLVLISGAALFCIRRRQP